MKMVTASHQMQSQEPEVRGQRSEVSEEPKH